MTFFWYGDFVCIFICVCVCGGGGGGVTSKLDNFYYLFL